MSDSSHLSAVLPISHEDSALAAPNEPQVESTVRPKSGESYPFLCGKCGGAQVMVAVYQRDGQLFTALNCAECGNRRESKVGK